MYRPREIRQLVRECRTGEYTPVGRPDRVEGVIGFSFGYGLDAKDRHTPGATNIALARFLSVSRLCEKPMVLQTEIADVLRTLEPGAGRNILAEVPTVKLPKGHMNTFDVVNVAAEVFSRHHIRHVAVGAFRHHMPRSVMAVEEAGLYAYTPDVRDVGDFDPLSAQPWTRSAEAWERREVPTILAFSLAPGLIMSRSRQMLATIVR